MPSWVSDVSPASSSDGDAAETSPFASVASVPMTSVVATQSLKKDEDVARMDRKRGDREAEEEEEEDAEDNFTGA